MGKLILSKRYKMGDDWWQFTLQHHGDVSAEFSNLFTPLFEQVAKDGLVDAAAWQSQGDAMNKWRLEKTSAQECDIHPISVDLVEKVWAGMKLPAGIDILTAVRVAWSLVNDG